MPLEPTCICPGDAKIQSLLKINNNLVILFETMASSFVGIQIGGNCLCSEALILQTINRNLIAAFAAITGSSEVQAGVEDLALNDTSKAIVFTTPFAAAPAVIPTINPPNDSGFNISPFVDESTRTATGVTIRFDAIPGAGYKLGWVAAEES